MCGTPHLFFDSGCCPPLHLRPGFLQVDTRSGVRYEFTNLERPTYEPLLEYLQEKRIRVTNLGMQQNVSGLAFTLHGSVEEKRRQRVSPVCPVLGIIRRSAITKMTLTMKMRPKRALPPTTILTLTMRTLMSATWAASA